MDFNTPRKIGEEIDKKWDQLEMVGGYDHNWCLDNYDGNVRLVAAASNPSGSRTMKVFTDLPGVQFYTSNGMAEQTGKGGANYGNRTASAWRPSSIRILPMNRIPVRRFRAGERLPQCNYFPF